MNSKRVIVLSFAGAMAIAAALLARGLVGGGTPKVEARIAPAVRMSDVLVAGMTLVPGRPLKPEQVRWERWPQAAVDASFITRSAGSDIARLVKGAVVRVPLMAGEPIAANAIVHGDQAGFMAAMLMTGMRAVSIVISADSGAGGFILPNDHVDLILARKLEGNPPRVVARTILTDVRVLAVDQTFKEDKNTKTVIGKTATLELTPVQAQKVEAAENLGTLSLSLRPLASQPGSLASNAPAGGDDGEIAVIRYGVSAPASGQEGR
ncbi:MAG: Flp pilus assembly protein CpaB [Rhizomicrobium sp.]